MTWWDWVIIAVYAGIGTGLIYIIWKLGKELNE